MTETLLRDPLREVRPGDRWLVAVAHPDDESFGCGSTIARAAAAGAAVTVACATRGEAGELPPGAPDCGDLGAVREAELHRAAAALGVARVELLGYRDSGFDGQPPPGSLCAADPAAVAAVLARLVADLRPTVVVVLDVSGVLDRREAAIAEHRSQASPFDGLSEPLRRAFLTTDHLARVPLEEHTP
jgi:N-acetyl-1-D-myo-inositol-2-amino-2-deoxy-alpha-D-glucopyranoside deacetylase